MKKFDEELDKCLKLEKDMNKCPFCGEKVEILHYENDGYLPKCSECDGMIEKWFGTPEEAVEEWNKRV